MAIDDTVENDLITGKVTGQRRAIDSTNALLKIIYLGRRAAGGGAFTCPECESLIPRAASFNLVPSGRTDMYGLKEYVYGFHCKVCEYQTPEFPPARS